MKEIHHSTWFLIFHCVGIISYSFLDLYGGIKGSRFSLSTVEILLLFVIVFLVSLLFSFLSGKVLQHKQLFQRLPNWNGFLSGCVLAFFLDHLSTITLLDDHVWIGIVAMLCCCAIFFRMGFYAQTSKQRLAFVSIIFAVFMAQLPTPKAPPKDAEISSRPSVLFVTIDALRAETFFAPDIQKLKNIRFLRKNAVVFDTVYAASTQEELAYKGLLYGDITQNNKKSTKDEEISFAQRFQQYGYSTAVYWSTKELSSKIEFQKGLVVIDDEFSSFRGWSLGMWGRFLPISEKQRSAGLSTEKSLQWAVKQRDPFFLWLNWSELQAPYRPPVEWSGNFFAGDPFENHDPMCERKIEKSHQEHVADRCNVDWIKAEYKAEIASFDRSLGAIIEYVQEHPNTLLVMVGGYGIHHTEHAPWFSNGAIPTAENVRVPLLFWFPSILPADKYIEQAISSADIMPTVFDILSFEVPTGIYGKSVIDVIYHNEKRENIISITQENDRKIWLHKDGRWEQKK